MDNSLPELFLSTFPVVSTWPKSSPSPSTAQEVGFESNASLIAVQQLNDARKAFLTSSTLPATHEFRKRANNTDGTLLPTQPDGAPRKPYALNKIPKPRARNDREAAGYFLARHRLVNMWNGKWTRESDWNAWDKSKAKMEKQFGNYRLVEKPPSLRGWQARERERRERKRKRERRASSCESPNKRRRHGNDTAEKQVEKELPFPTPEEVLAATPLEGIRMELLLGKFYQPKFLDTERFCSLLHQIGSVNRFTKMFVPGKRLDTSQDLEKHNDLSGNHPRSLLERSTRNACIQYTRMEAY